MYAFRGQEGATCPGAGARLLQATVGGCALEEQQCSHLYVCVFACGFVCMRAVPTEARKVSDLLELEFLTAFVSHPVWCWEMNCDSL